MSHFLRLAVREPRRRLNREYPRYPVIFLLKFVIAVEQLPSRPPTLRPKVILSRVTDRVEPYIVAARLVMGQFTLTRQPRRSASPALAADGWQRRTRVVPGPARNEPPPPLPRQTPPCQGLSRTKASGGMSVYLDSDRPGQIATHEDGCFCTKERNPPRPKPPAGCRNSMKTRKCDLICTDNYPIHRGFHRRMLIEKTFVFTIIERCRSEPPKCVGR
jgi:hypothetical protein